MMPKKEIPFDFVLEELAPLQPRTRPMFGCTSVYVGEKIVLILRRRADFPEDNGVWLATTADHHESLLRDLPSMRSLGLFGGSTTGWQNLSEDSDDFEEAVLKACELIRKRDPRIGKVPVRKLRSPKKKKTAKKIVKREKR